MSALYLGVVVLPLVFLVWNLGAGGRLRRMLRRGRVSVPAPPSPATPFQPAPWLTRLRALPRAFVAGYRAARHRPAAGDGIGTGSGSGETVPAGSPAASPSAFALAPDLPRSPSTPGWVPAHGYAARPRAAQASRDDRPPVRVA